MNGNIYRSSIEREQADQLLDLRRALGILDKRPHEEALLHAKHMAEAVDCMDWADEQEIEIAIDGRVIVTLDGGVIVTLWYPEGDGTMSAQCFEGPDLITVLREAKEWSERDG